MRHGDNNKIILHANPITNRVQELLTLYSNIMLYDWLKFMTWLEARRIITLPKENITKIYD